MNLQLLKFTLAQLALWIWYIYLCIEMLVLIVHLSSQEETYDNWAKDRDTLFKKHVEDAEKKELMALIKKKKKDLKIKEELLYFFEREKEIDVRQAEAKSFE